MALFDYDPATMSPNPESCDEELPFSDGDIIKVDMDNFVLDLKEGGWCTSGDHCIVETFSLLNHLRLYKR